MNATVNTLDNNRIYCFQLYKLKVVYPLHLGIALSYPLLIIFSSIGQQIKGNLFQIIRAISQKQFEIPGLNHPLTSRIKKT